MPVPRDVVRLVVPQRSKLCDEREPKFLSRDFAHGVYYIKGKLLGVKILFRLLFLNNGNSSQDVGE